MMKSPRYLLAVGAACALALSPVAASAAQPGDVDPIYDAVPDAPFDLSVAGTFETGIFDAGASEIVQAHGNRLFSVNADAGSVFAIDMTDPAAMSELYQVGAPGGVANSVAIRDDGLGVVALEDADDKTAPGRLLFFDANADEPTVLGEVTVGSLPDMVTVSPDGAYAVVANEGEPADDFSSDPEGSVGVVALPDAVAAPSQNDVRTADFHAFEGVELDDSVRDAFGPILNDEFPRSTTWEPEYVTVQEGTAYVALQEANAIATVDLDTATVTDVFGLGFIDRGVVPLDASDRDPEDAPTINIATYPGLYGVPMPDGVHSYRVGDETYIVTANEGDAREWGDYVEPARVKDLGTEDAPGTGPLCENLEGYDDDAALGRLEVTTEMGFDEQQGCYSELYAFGSRSFSIYSADGELVFDSGAEFEELSARLSENTPLVFNSGHDDNEFDSRSDAKGVEPENLTIGEVDGRSYAFIGFERLGGVIVYDVTDPAAPSYVEYINNRSFDVSLGDEYEALEEAGASEQELAELVNSVGDLGPEGLDFISAESSPTGVPMIVVGNEVTGSTTLYTLDGAPTAPAEDPVPEPTETAAPTPEPTETAAPAPSEEPAPAPSEKPSQEPTPAPAPGGDPAPSENPTQQPTPSEEPLAPTGGGVAWGLGAGAVALVAAGIVLAARTRRA
ncbi:MAG TPA: choice-of-anchor I family protein [Candidatus Microbacterium stercoravium]|uniref:Choice-of-anchor I family protein n=1 Tax=Candidatus Microbacterium stercoravium TaxID=2838697 RepID=A0A9D2H3Y2_9MICO|nr:choice-of-anchor I family protein [Candidatus Microbacterium stercoravium]